MKTVSARIRRSTTELEEMGESTDDLANGFSKYADEIQALTGFDIRVEGTLDTYKDIFEIFDGISAVWDDLTDTQQSRVSEILGGTRQLQVISSIMNNWEDAQNAYADAMDSANVAEEAQETHMESLEAKTEQFDASMQEFYHDFLDSDFAKGVVDWGTGFVQQVDNMVDSCGSLSVAIRGIGAAVAVSGVVKALRTMGTKGGFFNAFNTTWFGGVISSLQTVIATLTGATGAASSLSVALGGVVSAIGPIGIALAALAVGAGVVKGIQNHYENLRKELEESSTAWGESNDEVENYKARIEELGTALESGTLSDEEAYEAKSELLSIQESLTDSFGSEAEGIDLVNGKWEEQIALIDQMSAAEAGKFLKEQQSEIKRAEEAVEGFNRTIGVAYSNEEQSALRDIIEPYRDYFEITESPSGMYIDYVGNAEDAKDILEDVQTQIYELQESTEEENFLENVYEGAEDAIDAADDVLDKWQTAYDQIKEAELVSDTNLYSVGDEEKTALEWMSDYEKAVNDYNDALLSGNEADIAEARENFAELYSAMHELSNGDMSEYSRQIDQVTSSLDEASIKAIDFENALRGSVPEVEEFDNGALAEYEKQIEEYKLLANDATLYLSNGRPGQTGGKTASEWLYDYAEAIDKYNAALESGDISKISAARSEYEKLDNEIQSMANGSMSFYYDQIQEIASHLDPAADYAAIAEYADTLSTISISETDFMTNVVKQRAGNGGFFADFADEAEEYGISLENLASMLVEVGLLVSDTEDQMSELTFQDVLNDQELDLSGTIDNIKSEMSDLNDVFNDIRNGEEIDLSDMVINYGVSGNVETLEKELTDYGIDAVRTFVGDYNSAISGIEIPEELEKAQVVLDSVLSSFDVSSYLHDYMSAYSDYADGIKNAASISDDAAIKIVNDFKQAENDLQNIALGNILNNLTDAEMDNEREIVRYEDILSTLFKEYAGNEEALDIICRLSLDPSAAEWSLGEFRDEVEESLTEEANSFSNAFVDSTGNDTAFKTTLDNYKSDIDSLNDYMSQIQLGENIDMDQLLYDFPELSKYVDNLEEGISKLSFDELKGLGDSFAEALPEMGDAEAKALTEEFAEWIASADLSGLDFSGIWDQVKEGASESEQGVLEDIFGQYGENEFTAEVFYKLSLIPGSEGWSPEEIEEWFDKEYNLMVVARVDGGQLDKLSSDLDKIQTQADRIQNEMDRNDIFGIKNGEQQYRDLINNSNLEIQNLRQQLSLWEAIAQAVDPLSSEYAEAQSEIANIESEINSALSSQQEWNQAAAELRNAEGEALSAYNDATSTRNAGDNYDDIRSALESVNELWEEGKTGTDEFLAGTALASSAGIQDIENWESNYANMMRYFTEDTSGCINALQDLSEATNSAGEAMAKYDETTGEWTYRVDDIQRAADVLGISTENMVALMGRMEDYGGRNIWFETVEDGIAQTAELYSDLAQAEIDLQNMERKQQADMEEYGESSITDEMIQSQKDNITALKEWTYESNNLLSDLSSKSTEELEASMNAQYAAMTSMVDMASEIGDERVRNTYLQDIATWAQENGLNIADLFTYDDSTGQVTGLVDGALEELKETYDSDLYNMDLTSPMAEAAQDIGDTLTSNLADSESGVQEIVDSIISDFTEADLAGIEFNTGSLTEGYEEAESAMDNLLSAMGLGQEEGEALAQIMSSYMQLRDWDAAIQSVVESYGNLDTTLQQAQENGIISPDINLEANISEMSLDECQNGIEELTAQKATIEADAELDPTVKESLENQIDLLIDSYQDREIELGINQAVESGEMSLEDIINNPENLIATLGIEVDGEEQLEQLTSEIQSVATNMQQEQQLQLKVDAIIEGNEDISSVDDVLNLPEEELAVKCGLEMDSAELAQFESYIGYEEVEVPVTMQLEESQFEALTSQTEEVDVEVNTDDIAGQIESAVASASPTVDVTANVDDIAGQIEAAASGIEITVPVAVETSRAEVDTVSTAAPQSTSVTVTASVSGEGEVNSLTSAIEAVNSKYVAVTANVNGTAEVRALISAINSVTGKVVSVSAVVSGIGEVNSLAASIAAVQSKTVTVTTVTQTVSGGDATSSALGTAHASGTAYSMWTGYRHSVGAYANGSTQDWALPKNEQAIVNEIGTESIVYFCDFTWRHVLKNLFNCWEPVKPTKLQRDDEICVSANVAKAEKISWIMHGANLNII